MKKLTIILALFIIAFAAQTGSAQNISKEEQKALLIKASKFLEVKPFDKDAKDIRGWALRYVIETKDVSVIICATDFMKPTLDKKNKYSGELLAQYMIAMAAFKLENPSNTDETAAQIAGIESMLRTYETMVKEKDKAKFAGMDDLLVKRDNGELKKQVEAAKCGEKDSN